jgi:regulator of sirC expression with transglutaminase-like and TPR domain
MVIGGSRRFLFVPIVVCLAMSGCKAHAPDVEHPDIELVRVFLNLPDQQMDLGKIKLTIDRMIEPQIDVDKGLEQLDAMVAQVELLLPSQATARDKFDVLRAYLYKAGPWNDFRPFGYDLDDPFGHNIRNKLLPTYLATRKGNCVSMPLLVIVLAQRLGINVTAATAPDHILVKYRGETGGWLNFEATNGGFARDEWIRQENPMTQQALDSGIYMQPLTKKETAVVMLGTLMEFCRKQGRYEEIVPLATLALEHSPKDVSSMLAIGSAYWHQMDRDCNNKYTSPKDFPPGEWRRCSQLNDAVELWRAKAEALGWREQTAEANAEYLKRIDRTKAGLR